MQFTVETEQEDHGRWIGEIIELRGVLAYGKTREEAIARVQALALRVLADRLEHGELLPEVAQLFSVPASGNGAPLGLDGLWLPFRASVGQSSARAAARKRPSRLLGGPMWSGRSKTTTRL